MGKIIYWGIIRAVIVIPVIWLLQPAISSNFWIIFGLLTIYGVVIHPALMQYKLFEAENKEIIEDTLCSSCRNFDETAVLCLKYDKHPTREELPCGGVDWEPKLDSNYEEKEY